MAAHVEERKDRKARRDRRFFANFAVFAFLRREAAIATLSYAALTVVFTWPLARGLTHDIPGDFGDPLLNAWIIAWGGSHLGRGWWDAAIYFPHPLTLGYSEHLLPQALQVLPIHLVTANPILGYNVLFLSTFVLSGLGMFLFTRELTGNRAAAFVAGIAYAFAPYRVTSIPHLQVLSSQWLPFALYGFRRYFVAGRSTSLVGGAAAWLVQNLSCGYYLLFFSPVVLAYLAWEIATRSLWRRRSVIVAVLCACAGVFVVSGLITMPYLELRRLGFSPRSIEETTRFSADTWAFLTADPNLRLWGGIVQAWPRPEGALFPGFTIVVLAAVAAIGAKRGRTPAWMLIGLLLGLSLLGALLLGWTIRLPVLKIASFPRALLVVTALCAIAVIASPPARRAVREWLATPAGFFTITAVFAVVMSWGPSIVAKGRPIAAANLYSLFYAAVPGFDGVRAPARFGMVVAFALAILAGLGTAAALRDRRDFVKRRIAILAGLLVLLESIAVPIPINQNPIDYRQPGLAPLPDTVSAVPPVYGFVSTLPDASAIVELPLGEPAFDVRYMLYSTTHWRPLVNGYSGGAPAEYERLDQTLQDALTRPDRAWQALTATEATHVIVHEAFYAGGRGRGISEWLQARGARELAAFGSDRIFRIR